MYYHTYFNERILPPELDEAAKLARIADWVDQVTEMQLTEMKTTAEQSGNQSPSAQALEHICPSDQDEERQSPPTERRSAFQRVQRGARKPIRGTKKGVSHVTVAENENRFSLLTTSTAEQSTEKMDVDTPSGDNKAVKKVGKKTSSEKM